MEGSLVRCGVAHVEREELLVDDFGGFLVEAGFLEAIGPVEEPAVLGHACDEQSFGGFGRFVLGGEVVEEVVVSGLVFAGQDAKGVRVVVETVNGAVLTNNGLSDFRRWTRGMSRVLAIGSDLRFGGGALCFRSTGGSLLRKHGSSVLFAVLAIGAALFGAALGTF